MATINFPRIPSLRNKIEHIPLQTVKYIFGNVLGLKQISKKLSNLNLLLNIKETKYDGRIFHSDFHNNDNT